MKAIVIGLGSIGKRHAQNLMSLGVSVVGLEPNAEMRTLQIEYVDSIENATADIAFICSPTDMHIKQALKCAKKGMHIFIEKPPSNNLDGFTELNALCKEKLLVSMVACNFRFTEGIKKIKEIANSKQYGKLLSLRAYFGQYLPSMRKGRDYRQLYAATKAGGVVLDSFHEFDYTYWLLGKPRRIQSFKGKFSNLEIANEDMAEIIMKYDGALANIHVDYLRRKYLRSCEAMFENCTLVWEYRADEKRELLELYKNDGEKETLIDNKNLDVNRMYLDEMLHFLECVKTGKRPILDVTTSEKIMKMMNTVILR